MGPLWGLEERRSGCVTAEKLDKLCEDQQGATGTAGEREVQGVITSCAAL